MDSYKQLMNRADVVVNAALKEGAVTVSFDSMAMGKPLICIDSGGYTRYFSSEYAVVIPRTKRTEVIDSLTNAMIRLSNKDERKLLGQKAQKASLNFSWEHHGYEIREAIVSAYSTFTNKVNADSRYF
jgi:glycosyltransferase involved in cell wall biosynthesis